MIQEFKKFLLRGNVVDLAVAVVIGAAFGAIVTALVQGLITPLVAALTGSPDFSNLGFTLNESKFNYGIVVNAALSFIIIAAVVFFLVVVPINALMARSRREPTPDPTTTNCPECLSEIPIGAKRCAFCTAKVATAS
jgi:large conductance mechanosensitive channel